ncbi:hypothetical protein HYE67_002636 [Fusarium culmorum]|uniref:Protein mms22 n=1 Tax=Fusarium culmorum TaxID=5516 RepID=A0A7S8D226_FUSCU|nr:hypothetical protein HYE67_002636 [Fusarium culmorum]
MTNWMELGEVPDSEEEDGFESQELPSLPGIIPINTTDTEQNDSREETLANNQAENQQNNDIWDVPDSSQEFVQPALATSTPSQKDEATTKPPAANVPIPNVWDVPSSSPLSSIHSDDDLPEVGHLHPRPPTAPTESGNVDQTQQEHRANEGVLNSYVERSSPPPDFTNSRDATRSPSVLVAGDDGLAPVQSQDLGVDEYQTAQQAAVPHERSFRKRKPIQEHPYMIEASHYSTTLRNHGLRPIKVVTEEEKRRRRQTEEEASQDKEFEEESQESHLPDVSDESQPRGLDDFPDGMDTLDIPSPSPPKTSPRVDRAGPSSQASSSGDTESTSIAGDDLPELKDFKIRPPTTATKQTAKRKPSPSQSSARKRKKYDVVHSDPLEPAWALRLRLFTTDSPAAQRSSRMNGDDSLTTADGSHQGVAPPFPVSTGQAQSFVRLTKRPAIRSLSDSEDELAGPTTTLQPNDEDAAAQSDSDSGSESGSEMVTTVGRRIRGVLPASWLRLDQQAGHKKTSKDVHKKPAAFLPEQEIRRGVAQRRTVTSNTPTALETFLEESDDDDDGDSAPAPDRQETTDETFHKQTRLLIRDDSPILIPEDLSDDDGSVIEDNAVDHMVSGRKRQLKLSESFQGTAKRHKNSSTQRTPSASKGPHQPRITSMLSGSRGNSAPAAVRKSRQPVVKRKPHGRKRSSKNARKRYAPPRLSILDVVEPDAPRFLKIAARSATRRQDMGRSSSSRKFIKLATRDDNIDAVSVLNNWRSGSIPQRQSVTTALKAKKSRPKPRGPEQPLRETSGNGSPAPRHVNMHRGVPRRLVKQVSQAGSVRYQADSNAGESQTMRKPRSTTLTRSGSGFARPAQLETDETDQTTRLSFNATKRRLDRLFRKQRGDLSASSIMTFDNASDAFYPASPPPEENPVPLRVVEKPSVNQNKSRFRKKMRPQCIDVEAPQFSRADDPIPTMLMEISEPIQSVEASGGKMQGLGPYGTHYTHHFEIFPLDSHAYFHESTLIGSGALELATRDITCQHLLEARPRISFNFGDQVLRWGPWDAQVSSELGVLLDSTVDQLERIPIDEEVPDSKFATSAARFIMKFVLDSLSFADHTQVKIFVCRVLEALQGFNGRIGALLRQQDDTTQPRYSLVASVYDHLLLATLFVQRICQGEASLMSEQFQIEDLLKGLSRTAVTSLMMTGIDHITKTYEDLKSPRMRERGLRNNMPVIHSWVINMKVLEHAHISRASFWDTLYAVIDTPEASTSIDASIHERLWRNMFTLLPLTEFNDKGIVVAGRRYDDMVVDGWSLPQKLLKRVFQIYQENSRQSPSFSNYCRALVGRCHYLVQQWGWRKCVPVIGVIFDFFGSQNLAHFRNEEVYTSPKFLDELAGSPSLSIDKADNCFHIFLKLIALSIRKFSDTKDIRNLIARTMPNHNRQLLKEQVIQERDLAALRNHHDLLCTLFWASPAELRPGAHLIERLVTPASSHKEACLINLRAWSQLARFIISTGEATTAFKPFSQWRNNFFQSMMDQFDSVQSDMQQQVLAMSKDGSNTVDPGLIDAMVAMNRRAVMDVLYMSVTMSLDVMKHAPNLEAATFALNTQQLQQVFRRFTAYPSEFDWSILRASLSTLDAFLSRVDAFKDDEGSQESESQILDSAQADDALLVIDHDLSKVYFSMARCLLSSQGKKDDPSKIADMSHCTEQVIILTARLAVRFINGGLLRLADMFRRGKYSLFEDVPAKCSLDQRRHLTLFLTTLLKHNLDDFKEAGFSLSEAWALSIVKPRPYLSYENQFAEQLWKHQKGFVPEAVMGLSINPDYNSNRDLFEFIISWMRKSVRDAGPALKKQITPEHSKTLKLVMEQMQSDLHTMCHDPAEHPGYVAFVRDVIALIRAHGSDICKIDKYFYQISREYSPSIQDPQLQVAAMRSYGIKMSEGDNGVVHQVFYFLCNNFKLSLKENKLGDEVQVLHRGMANQNILSFILSKMLPAIVRAAGVESYAFAMIEVYAEAVRMFMANGVSHREWTESDLQNLLVLFRAVVSVLEQLGQTDGPLQPEHVHLITQVIYLSNILWPSLYGSSLLPINHRCWTDVVHILRSMRAGLDGAERYVADMVDVGDYSLRAEILLSSFRRPGAATPPIEKDVKTFTSNIVDDIRKLWVTTGPNITIEAPRRVPEFTQTQPNQGTPAPVWEPELLVNKLYDELRIWNEWWIKAFDKRRTPMKMHIPVLF